MPRTATKNAFVDDGVIPGIVDITIAQLQDALAEDPTNIAMRTRLALATTSKALNLPYVGNRRQLEAHLADETGMDHPVLYGGAMGGGKSWFLCGEAIRECLEVPGNRVLMGRLELKTFRNTTLQTLLQVIPRDVLHKPSQATFFFPNGSQILYTGLGSEDDKRKLQSMEIGCFLADEVTELPYPTFLMAGTRLRWKPAADAKRTKVRCTCNPEPGWVKEHFVTNPKAGYRYIKATPLDNIENLPDGYMDQMRGSLPSEWFQAYMMGDWDAFVPTDSVLPSSLLDNAVRTICNPTAPLIWGLDVARFGNDQTVLAQRAGTPLTELRYSIIDTWNKTDIPTSADNVLTRWEMARVKPVIINVDDDGVGGGVTDLLKRAKAEGKLGSTQINAVIAQASAIASTVTFDMAHYTNVKAQLWFKMRAILESAVPVSLADHPLELKSGLEAHRYEVRTGRATVEPKTLVKARLGYSPDHADAVILTNYEGRGDYVAHATARERLENELRGMSREERELILAHKARTEQQQRIFDGFSRRFGVRVPGTGRDDGLGY